jgi:hypothetical protein
MKPHRTLRARIVALACPIILLLAVVLVLRAYAQRSTGIVVESVNNYTTRNGPSIPNSIANGDGFLQNMVFLDSGWHLNARYVDGSVYDTDFMDSSVDPRGADQSNFDMPGTAISYFTGHGFCHTNPMGDGCSTQQACTTSTACTTPNTSIGERLPGSCRFSPVDPPRCCYMADRGAATSGAGDKFNGVVDYTNGPIRWGNNGTNMVVLDISCGILPTFWYQALQNASAGVHMFATIMVASGDTAGVVDRGATFAMFDRAYALARVSDSWLSTMNYLPASEGNPCPGGGGGHGYNGCGCNIVVAMDNSSAAAVAHMSENWVDLQDDSKDSKGNSWLDAEWQCNYPLKSTTQTAWELP